MTPGHGHKVLSNIGEKGVVTSTLALQPGLKPIQPELIASALRAQKLKSGLYVLQIFHKMADSSSSLPPFPASAPPVSFGRCCKCNRTAKCVRCICVKYRRPCSSCLPGDLERRQNRPRPSPASSSSVTAPASQASTVSQPSPPSSSSPSPPSLPSHSPSLPSLESIFHMRLSTLRRVPKACRDTWARVVGEVFQGINSDNCNPDWWVRFFMLARCILACPPRGGRSHWRDIQRRVKQRLAKWRDGQIMELWEDILDENNRLNASLSQKRSTPSPFSNIHRALLAAEDGQYHKALQALSSVGIAPPSKEVLEAMTSKHPQSALPTIPASPLPQPVHVSEPDVLRALQSSPPELLLALRVFVQIT